MGFAALCAVFLLPGCGGHQELMVPEALPPEPDEVEPALETVADEPAPEPEPVGETAIEAEPEPPVEAEPEPEEAAAQPDVVVPLEGSLVSRKGKKVVIEVDHPDPPAAGAKGTLLKYFEKQVGPFATSGWLAIAEVTVKKSAGGKIHLAIVEELSKMVVNGKKVNHFKKGNKVKLELE